MQSQKQRAFGTNPALSIGRPWVSDVLDACLGHMVHMELGHRAGDNRTCRLSSLLTRAAAPRALKTVVHHCPNDGADNVIASMELVCTLAVTCLAAVQELQGVIQEGWR